MRTKRFIISGRVTVSTCTGCYELMVSEDSTFLLINDLKNTGFFFFSLELSLASFLFICLCFINLCALVRVVSLFYNYLFYASLSIENLTVNSLLLFGASLSTGET